MPWHENEMLIVMCWRPEFNWELQKTGHSVTSPIPDVWHFGHYGPWWLYLTLGYKGLCWLLSKDLMIWNH